MRFVLRRVRHVLDKVREVGVNGAAGRGRALFARLDQRGERKLGSVGVIVPQLLDIVKGELVCVPPAGRAAAAKPAASAAVRVAKRLATKTQEQLQIHAMHILKYQLQNECQYKRNARRDETIPSHSDGRAAGADCQTRS